MLHLPIELKATNLKPVAFRVLSRKHGLNLKLDALAVLAEVMGPRFGAGWKGPQGQQFLEEVADAWKAQERGQFVDGEGLRMVLGELDKAPAARPAPRDSLATPELADSTPATLPPEAATAHTPAVVSSFDLPRFQYSTVTRGWEVAPPSHTAGWIARYNLLKDRVARSTQLATPITEIKNLLGRHGQRFLLLGVLGGEPGEYTLEDPSDSIPLDLAQAVATSGAHYTTGMVLLCDGIYLNAGKFYVLSVGQPPCERRAATLNHLGHADLLGLHGTTMVDRDTITRAEEAQHHSLLEMVFAGCNTHLDDPKVLAAIRRLLTHIADRAEVQSRIHDEPAAKHLPDAVVFSGPFVSTSLHTTGTASSLAAYRRGFDQLAELVELHPLLHTCRFVFVPGDNDPWWLTHSKGAPAMWPQHPVPQLFGSRLKRTAPQSVFTLNPCRVAHMALEIAVCRGDLGRALRLNRADLVVEEEALVVLESIREARTVVRTLLDQGNLLPVSTTVRPVNWEHEHALQLTPVPTVMVLADASTARFDVTYEGCRAINPGVLVSNGRVHFTRYAMASGKAYAESVDI